MGGNDFSPLIPPRCDECEITFPAEHVVLVAIAREKKMNTTTRALSYQLDALFRWFDSNSRTYTDGQTLSHGQQRPYLPLLAAAEALLLPSRSETISPCIPVLS